MRQTGGRKQTVEKGKKKKKKKKKKKTKKQKTRNKKPQHQIKKEKKGTTTKPSLNTHTKERVGGGGGGDSFVFHWEGLWIASQREKSPKEHFNGNKMQERATVQIKSRTLQDIKS